MVKKTSIFGKIKNRLRSSAVSVDTEVLNGSRGPTDAIARRDEKVSGRKMSGKEEAVVAIQDGFKELSSLLRGVQSRVDAQGERLANSTEALGKLPALNQSQVELMRMLADRLDKQDQANEVIIHSFGEMPTMLQELRTALDRSSATDERTAKTLGEFQSNMSRIQKSMGDMVDSSKKQASATAKIADGAGSHSEALASAVSTEQKKQTEAVRAMVDRLDRNQVEGFENLRQTTDDSLGELRSVHADQSNRLGKIIEDGTKVSRAMVILLGLVFVALCAVGTVMIMR